MKNSVICLLIILLFSVACNTENKEENTSEPEVAVNTVPINVEDEQNNIDSANDTKNEEIIIESEKDYISKPVETKNYGVYLANFISASMVEGEIGLHFIEKDTEKSIDFYYSDIDPVEEGLFSYKEVEDSFFPELVSNPEIKDVVFKLFWKIENRYIGLADEYEDVMVLKSVEILN
ncbi:MAG: hypothetical protein L3J35_05985 [Bacteroidales bacterium]|nr:hypothetical protein [Bacteroidales bacterium]